MNNSNTTVIWKLHTWESNHTTENLVYFIGMLNLPYVFSKPREISLVFGTEAGAKSCTSVPTSEGNYTQQKYFLSKAFAIHCFKYMCLRSSISMITVTCCVHCTIYLTEWNWELPRDFPLHECKRRKHLFKINLVMFHFLFYCETYTYIRIKYRKHIFSLRTTTKHYIKWNWYSYYSGQEIEHCQDTRHFPPHPLYIHLAGENYWPNFGDNPFLTFPCSFNTVFILIFATWMVA